MNKFDKWCLLNWVIPSIVAGIVAYYVAKHYGFIHSVIAEIFG